MDTSTTATTGHGCEEPERDDPRPSILVPFHQEVPIHEHNRVFNVGEVMLQTSRQEALARTLIWHQHRQRVPRRVYSEPNLASIFYSTTADDSDCDSSASEDDEEDDEEYIAYDETHREFQCFQVDLAIQLNAAFQNCKLDSDDEEDKETREDSSDSDSSSDSDKEPRTSPGPIAEDKAKITQSGRPDPEESDSEDPDGGRALSLSPWFINDTINNVTTPS